MSNKPPEQSDAPLLPQAADIVQQAIDDAILATKRERTSVIASLLDKAAKVLEASLDDDRPAAAKLRTVEVAIGLYNSQEEHVRQDKRLQLQKEQLELERQKLIAPGGPLFQQNNLYVNGRQAVPALSEEDERELLLQRKRAQDAVLAAYLKPRKLSDIVVEGTVDEEGDNT